MFSKEKDFSIDLELVYEIGIIEKTICEDPVDAFICTFFPSLLYESLVKAIKKGTKFTKEELKILTKRLNDRQKERIKTLLIIYTLQSGKTNTNFLSIKYQTLADLIL